MIEYEKEMIEVSEELVIGFIRHGNKYFEYLASFFSLDFPDLTEEDYDEIIEWADQNATFIHKEEYEYIFSIAYWDNKFIKNINVPEKIAPIFLALIKFGRSFNKDKKDQHKEIPHLHLWVPKQKND